MLKYFVFAFGVVVVGLTLGDLVNLGHITWYYEAPWLWVPAVIVPLLYAVVSNFADKKG